MKRLVSGLIFVVAMMCCSAANAQNYQQMADQMKSQAQAMYAAGTTYYNGTVSPAANQIYTNAPRDANGNFLAPKNGWSYNQTNQYLGYIQQGNTQVGYLIQYLDAATDAAYHYDVAMNGSTYSDGSHNPGGNDYYAQGNYYNAYINYQTALNYANQRLSAYQAAYSYAVQAGQAYSSAGSFYNDNPG